VTAEDLGLASGGEKGKTGVEERIFFIYILL
jgi:hypothetical protein